MLDDEVNKWELVEETPTRSSGPASPPRIHRRPSLSNLDETQTDERPSLLTPQEMDTIKLMFSLMDTDGSLELSSTKVSQFILNILGEKISTADAEAYLDALDYDRNGVVDFADILSWVAVMKANRNKHESSRLLSWPTVQSGRKVIKSSSIRVLGSASLVLYMVGVLSGRERGWLRLSLCNALSEL
ncbi:hypothetical protein PInf_015907 [Phytophthora infestans]|nr:hypothetical protein PInf_015907 [Phytophthora infestans]